MAEIIEKINGHVSYRMNDVSRFNFASYYDGDDNHIPPQVIADVLNNSAALATELSSLRAEVEGYRAMLEDADVIEFENGDWKQMRTYPCPKGCVQKAA